MKADYPDTVDDFRLQLTRAEYNAGVSEDRPLSPLRTAYILNAIEAKLGGNNSQDQNSHDYRVKAVEAITAVAITQAGTNLVKTGNTLALSTNPSVTTLVLPNGVVLAEASGRLFLAKNVLVQGPDGYNATAETAIIYLGDTNVSLKAEFGFGFKLSVAGIADALTVAENSGDLGTKGNVLLQVGKVVKINATQVLAARITGWTAPTGTATRTGFDTATVLVKELAEAVKALIDDLRTHGLIGS